MPSLARYASARLRCSTMRAELRGAVMKFAAGWAGPLSSRLDARIDRARITRAQIAGRRRRHQQRLAHDQVERQKNNAQQEGANSPANSTHTALVRILSNEDGE